MSTDRKYPPEREDWLMVEEYKKKKTPYHCILCAKTHRIVNCPNKQTQKKKSDEYKSMYTSDDHEYNPHNYGW